MKSEHQILRGKIMVSMPTLVSIEHDNNTYISLTEGEPNWKDCWCDFYLLNASDAIIVNVLDPESRSNNTTAVNLRNLEDFRGFQEFTLELVSSTEEKIELLSDETIDLLKDLKEYILSVNSYDNLNLKDNFPNCESFHGLISSLVESLENISPKSKAEYYWGIWRNDEKDILTSGYDNSHFLRSYHLPDTSERRAEYRTPPPNLKWPIIKVEQKNKIFFLGKAAVQEIAQTSFVPHLPPIIQPEDSATRVLNRDQNSNQWQRNADRARIKKIQDFIEFDSNLITNTPMLYLSRNECVTIHDDCIEIHFDKFLQKDNDFFVDRKRVGADSNNNIAYTDYRPFWIIDGQHRIHGINNSNKKTEELGIILFDDSFDVSQTAKIFAEINTLQQKLPLLHEIFMAHRFKLSHNNPNRTFRDISSSSYEEAKLGGWGQEWLNSRANSYSYEIAAMLCSTGTLKGELQFLPQNPSKSYMYSADQWIIYTRKWFTNNGIYGTNHENAVKVNFENDFDYARYIFTEVNNFFNALHYTFRKERYTDGKSRWSNPNSNFKPLITKKSNFAILLELYPRINRKARMITKQSIFSQLSKEDFVQALLPISNVDWLDKELNDFYSGGGERPRRALQSWISDAIAFGKRSSQEEIMKSSNRSKPGKGILSPLARPPVKVSTHPPYFISSEINLQIKRPYNARYEGKLIVYNSLGEEVKNFKLTHNTELDNTLNFSLKIGKEFENENSITIRIEYFNMHSTVSGYWSKDFEISVKT